MSPAPLPEGTRLLVLYDGLCGLCDGLVQRLLRWDRRSALAFAPLQGETAAAVRGRHPDSAGLDSILVVTALGTPNERLLVRSAAVLAIAAALGGWLGTLAALRLVPRPLRDWLYDVVARRRTRWFGTLSTCRLPTPAERRRFLP